MKILLSLIHFTKNIIAYQLIKSSDCKNEIFDDLRRVNNDNSDKQITLKIFSDKISVNKCYNNMINQRMRKRNHFKSIILRIIFPLKKDMEINDCTIGSGFICYHGHGTVICANRIGNNFSIWHGVTIGKNGSDKCPIIGDNVSIHTNALVAGDIIIGNNVEIGAGAIVLKDVPSNCIVIGNPARIIKENDVKVNKLL